QLLFDLIEDYYLLTFVFPASKQFNYHTLRSRFRLCTSFRPECSKGYGIPRTQSNDHLMTINDDLPQTPVKLFVKLLSNFLLALRS
ncbi:MAG: hypothetical protein ACQEQ0_15005, partial [Bacteroidota bacterium]